MGADWVCWSGSSRSPRPAPGPPCSWWLSAWWCSERPSGRIAAHQPSPEPVVVASSWSRTTLVVVVGTFVAYLGASTPAAGWFGGGIRHGDRGSGLVAITFDDGPNTRTTPAVAAILDRYHTKGTFFIVGKALDALARTWCERSTETATSSATTPTTTTSGAGSTLATPNCSARRTRSSAISACVPRFFRPPHGQRTPFMRWVAEDQACGW